MRQVHPDSFTEQQLLVLGGRNARPIGPIFENCPICGTNDAGASLEDHIVGHLRSLALRSLPAYEDEASESSYDNAGSSTASRPVSRATIQEDPDKHIKPVFSDVGNQLKGVPEVQRHSEWGFLTEAIDAQQQSLVNDPIMQAIMKKNRKDSDPDSDPDSLPSAISLTMQAEPVVSLGLTTDERDEISVAQEVGSENTQSPYRGEIPAKRSSSPPTAAPASGRQSQLSPPLAQRQGETFMANQETKQTTNTNESKAKPSTRNQSRNWSFISSLRDTRAKIARRFLRRNKEATKPTSATLVESETPDAQSEVPNAKSEIPNSFVHRVLLDFEPTMEDEMQLKAGELVRLLHEFDDGWVSACTYRLRM